MATDFYSSQAWRDLRARALARDGRRCTVSRLLGGSCTELLHAHHIVARSEGGAELDLENVATSCSAHHPMWESLRRVLARRALSRPPRCPHVHRSREAREICERRLARQFGSDLAAA